ncbi:MAG: hypothetical protein WC011_02105 [Candidatus Paceibacterota bacterium]
MRISFVGKGGSGKSTLSSSFASYVVTKNNLPVLVFDADLNIHIPELLGFDSIPTEKHLSGDRTSGVIKRWLIGQNDIPNLGAFRKSTPPTRKSNIIKLESIKETPIGEFGFHRGNLSVFAVGTYQEEDIGSSCYHNNLSVLENILSHTDDINGFLITDMVAGVDSFAGTLHAQFDLTCLVVEPTMRSVEVYKKYMNLAIEAGIGDTVKVIGNKIRNENDKEFIETHVPVEKIIGYFYEDQHIRDIDQNGDKLSVVKLNNSNQELLSKIFNTIMVLPDNRNQRLNKIWDLHKKYVAQSFIKDRFGDLENQIDPDFIFIDEKSE